MRAHLPTGGTMRTRARLTIGFIALGGLFLLAASGRAAQAPPDSRITGRVLAKASGSPVSGVLVSIAGQSTRTDAEGRFSLGSLPEGRWRLGALKEGYLLAGLDGKPANQTVYGTSGGIYYRVDAGTRTSLDLYLLSGGTVSGTVLNERAEPR